METEIPMLPASTWEYLENLISALSKKKVDNTKKKGTVLWCGKGFAKSYMKITKRNLS